MRRGFRMGRRDWLRGIALATCPAHGFRVAAGEKVDDALRGRLQRGERFLAKLFDREMELLPEYSGSKTYWLYHDNYLAAKILAVAAPETSKVIEKRIRSFGVSRSGKIEIVFGESMDALPFKEYELVEVARIGENVVRTERVTDRALAGWEEYSDLLLLASIAETREDASGAYFDRAVRMWDGVGLKDRVVAKSGIYATYKLGLLLLACRRLRRPLPFASAAEEILLSLQSKEGGWITDYTADREPRGFANVETTCLVMLGLGWSES